MGSINDKFGGFTTRRVHADRLINHPQDGAVHTPQTSSVLFEYTDAQEIVDVFQGKKPGHVYARSSSGSVVALQTMMQDLEEGVGSVCFATGMAAISGALLALFRQGDHLIVSQYLFGNTRSFFNTLADLGVQITYVDVTSVEAVDDAYQPNTRGVYTETIANPVTQVADLNAIGRFCASRNILFMVDNTMTPPPLFNASAMNASLVFSSLTKYVGGHGNALGGCVTDTGHYDWTRFANIKEVYRTGDPAQWGLTQIKKRGLRDMGATMASSSAHALSVGMETLALRMTRSCNNALKLATFLENQRQVKRVYYPGLSDHPQHFIAREQMNGYYGAVLSLDLQDGYDPIKFLNNLQLIICATHLGDNRTLALPVAQTIFHESGKAGRAEMGISENMIRMSVGIEEIDDLVSDVSQALQSLS
ncbi:cystathionine gamma-synthase family protein [Alteromonas sp. CYL-A6]|uniref:cystathionine gamma-synthase family protein n=1 Tax=Alteromonas nitratireducens TaxID=3390813 RepID=UPI0034ABA108